MPKPLAAAELPGDSVEFLTAATIFTTEAEKGTDIITEFEQKDQQAQAGKWFTYYSREKRRGPAALPFHSLEGYSGGSLTTVAWICNTCKCDPRGLSLPAVSVSFANIGSKELTAAAVTQSLFNRVELGYGIVHMNMGSLYDDSRKLFQAIDGALPIPVSHMTPTRKYIRMHNINMRLQVIEEGQFLKYMPAVAAAVQFKYNQDIKDINRSLYESVVQFDLGNYGYKRNYGFDYTLAVSKKYRDPLFDRPVFNSVAYRLSQASQLGLLGFGGAYRGTFEFNVGYMPLDFLLIGYEYRQKKSAYRVVPDADAIPGITLGKLIQKEDDFQAISTNFMLGRNGTLSLFWGVLGRLANARTDNALGIQLKWEF